MTAVVSFAVSNAGMTVAVSRTETILAASWEVRCLSKGSSYFWLRWKSDDVYGMPATASTGATWAAVTGRPTDDSRWYPVSAPFNSYHLFTDGTMVHCAAEQSVGAWQHFTFGDITKYGSWTGGHFVGMTYTWWNNSTIFLTNPAPAANYSACGFTMTDAPFGFVSSNGTYSYLYAPKSGRDYASAQGAATPATYNKMFVWGYGGGGTNIGDYEQLATAQLNNFNGRTPGLRMEAFMYDDGASLHWMPIGYFSNIRMVNIRDLSPADTINTDWMVFPLCKKSAGGTFNVATTSANYGWAIRK